MKSFALNIVEIRDIGLDTSLAHVPYRDFVALGLRVVVGGGKATIFSGRDGTIGSDGHCDCVFA
jgi:hypothetical protein